MCHCVTVKYVPRLLCCRVFVDESEVMSHIIYCKFNNQRIYMFPIEFGPVSTVAILTHIGPLVLLLLRVVWVVLLVLCCVSWFKEVGKLICVRFRGLSTAPVCVWMWSGINKQSSSCSSWSSSIYLSSYVCRYMDCECVNKNANRPLYQ